MTGDEGSSLRFEIWIESSPERVFRALVDPADLTSWWAIPGAYATREATVDLRPGGRYRLTGSSERLGSFELTGEYLVVDEPEELAYTWNPDWDEDARGTVVRFRLKPVRDGTLLQVEHTGFRSRRSAEDHESGWPAVGEALRDYVESL